MSRTIKKAFTASRMWIPCADGDAPGTEEAGAREPPHGCPRSKRQMWTIKQRRRFGSTEKILRRNRRMWCRLTAKIGRRLDREAVVDGME